MTQELRIAIGGIRHETNTFSPVWTAYADFRVRHGDDVLDNGAQPLWAGESVKLLSTFVASAWSAGMPMYG